MRAVRAGARRARDDTSGSEAEIPEIRTARQAPAPAMAPRTQTRRRRLMRSAPGRGKPSRGSAPASPGGAGPDHHGGHVVALAGASAKDFDVLEEAADDLARRKRAVAFPERVQA